MSEVEIMRIYHQKLHDQAVVLPGIRKVVLDIVVVFLVRRDVAVTVEAFICVVVSAKNTARMLICLSSQKLTRFELLKCK